MGWAKACLRHRVLTCLAALAFLVGSFMLVPFLPTGFIPPDDLSQTQVTVNLPPGSNEAGAAKRDSAEAPATKADSAEVALVAKSSDEAPPHSSPLTVAASDKSISGPSKVATSVTVVTKDDPSVVLDGAPSSAGPPVRRRPPTEPPPVPIRRSPTEPPLDKAAAENKTDKPKHNLPPRRNDDVFVTETKAKSTSAASSLDNLVVPPGSICIGRHARAGGSKCPHQRPGYGNDRICARQCV
jgi:multidrug efflux pump subunit AcrB